MSHHYVFEVHVTKSETMSDRLLDAYESTLRRALRTATHDDSIEVEHLEDFPIDMEALS